jgi:non-specific protein-tyrosine kinase
MAIKRYAGLLWRRLWLLVLCTALAAGAAFGVSVNSTPMYEASTTLLIHQAPSSGANADYNSLLASELLANTYAQMLQESPIFEQVIKELNLSVSAEELGRNVKVDVIRDTQLIGLTVTDRDPAKASAIANKVVSQFSAQNQAIQEGRYSATKQSLEKEMASLQSDIQATQASLASLQKSGMTVDTSEREHLQTLLSQERSNYTALLNSLEGVRLAEAQSTNNVIVVKDATPQYTPVSPKTGLNVMLAAFLGLILAVMAVLARDYFDDALRSPEEVEQAAGTSIVGLIARIPGAEQPDRLTTFANPRSSTAEAYRILRTNIDFSGVDKPVKTLAVTSSRSEEGKSITVANLAVAIAETGKRVIAIDTDLRRPTLHTFFRQSNKRGVTSALISGGMLSEHIVSTSIPNLRLMPSGPIPPNPAELLGSARMSALIEALKSDTDFIIFDTTPILPVTDALLVAGKCDATLLVARSGVTTSVGLKKAKDQLDQAGMRVLGVVLNHVPTGRNTTDYYYHYEQSESRESKAARTRKSSPPARSKRGLPFIRSIRPGQQV